MKRSKYLLMLALLVSACSQEPEENIHAQSKEILASPVSSIVLLNENKATLVINGQCETVGGYKPRWCSQEETSLVSFTYALSLLSRAAPTKEDCASKFLIVRGKGEGVFITYGEGCYSIGDKSYTIPKEETDRMRKMAISINKTISTSPTFPI